MIEATAEGAHALGWNTICLEPNVVVIGAEHGRFIREIEKRGARTLRTARAAVAMGRRYALLYASSDMGL